MTTGHRAHQHLTTAFRRCTSPVFIAHTPHTQRRKGVSTPSTQNKAKGTHKKRKANTNKTRVPAKRRSSQSTRKARATDVASLFSRPLTCRWHRIRTMLLLLFRAAAFLLERADNDGKRRRLFVVVVVSLKQSFFSFLGLGGGLLFVLLLVKGGAKKEKKKGGGRRRRRRKRWKERERDTSIKSSATLT